MYTVYCTDGIADKRFSTREEAVKFLIKNFKDYTGELLTEDEKDLLFNGHDTGMIEEIKSDYATTVVLFEDENICGGNIIFISKKDDKNFSGLFSNVEEGVK